MECFGSRENILKAKLEILEGLNKKGTVIINYDNDLLNKWYKKQQEYNVITYGIQDGSDILGKDVILKDDGSSYRVVVDGESHDIWVPVGGEHFVSNSLCALAVAKALDVQMQDAIKGIEDFELTKKRMEIKKAKCGAFVINDSYNANYDSMKAALEYLGKLPNNRKIAVLGDMLELGEYSKVLHEKVGEEVSKNKINLLICVGEEAKNIAKKAQEKGMETSNIMLCKTNEEAIEILNKELNSGDAVLLKASNSLNFTQICDAIAV